MSMPEVYVEHDVADNIVLGILWGTDGSVQSLRLIDYESSGVDAGEPGTCLTLWPAAARKVFDILSKVYDVE